jgi:hypothetical protein
MKEESTIPPDLDQEVEISLSTHTKVSWEIQEEEGESLDQSNPSDQGNILEGETQNLSKTKESWTTIVRKKKYPSVA